MPRKSEIKKKLTTVAGAPVVDNQNTMTAGPRGPALLQDVWFLGVCPSNSFSQA